MGVTLLDCRRKDALMLFTIAAILVILWLLGMVSSYTLGGFIHLLLILAIIAVLVRVIQGRSPV
jgi:asparagine N-glycosylation enzyme membrane subunit Stt3